jgi:hypothetical protein
VHPAVTCVPWGVSIADGQGARPDPPEQESLAVVNSTSSWPTTQGGTQGICKQSAAPALPVWLRDSTQRRAYFSLQYDTFEVRPLGPPTGADSPVAAAIRRPTGLHMS